MRIKLTETAINHIAKSLQNRGKGIGIKVGVKSTGCSGFAYTLEYVDDPLPHQYLDSIWHPGFSVFIHPEHCKYFDNAELDFVKQGLNQGFEFKNSAEKARCGCGESFTL